jgi:predicted nucleic acid-binding protein
LSTYADSSFMVALYLHDVHTPEPLRRMTPGNLAYSISQVGNYARHRSDRVSSTVSSQVADRIYKDLERDCDAGVWRLVDMPAIAFATATALGQIHVPQIGARILDTLHVASALELKAQRFWTFDERQAKLARAAGLKVS